MYLVSLLLATLALEFFVISAQVPKGASEYFQPSESVVKNEERLARHTVLIPLKLPSYSLTQSSLFDCQSCTQRVVRPIDFMQGSKRQICPIMSNQRSQGKHAEAIFGGSFYPLKCFQNAWYDGFFVHHDRTGKDNLPAIDTRKNLGSIEGNLEGFLQTGDSSSPYEADEVMRYCNGGLKLKSVENGSGEAGNRKAAWVDDRNSPHLTGTGNVRLCGAWLTATGLWRHLRQPVSEFLLTRDEELLTATAI
jgi:hypothetical protein